MEQFKNQFDVTTVKNIVEHIAIVAGVSLVVALGQYALSLHFGQYDFVIIPLLTSIVNAARQYNTGV